MRIGVGLATVALLLVTCGASQASVRSTALSGTWFQLINCLPTSFDPLTDQIHCIGSSSWSGTWTGTTTYTMDGKYNVLTGDSTGVIHEVFTGKASDGTSGKLTFTEQLKIVGATSKLHINATIVGASGGFAGSTGKATFDGTDVVLVGSGTYAGTWARPCACGSSAARTEHIKRTHFARRHRR
jgi:hypothetical protein